MYKNLDIITNKATESEMKGIKHHLIGYLDSNCITNVVTDYKNKAVDLVYCKLKTIHKTFYPKIKCIFFSFVKIDNLLDRDIVPILVGGTHYYIQSIVWDILIDVDPDDQASSDVAKSRKHELDLSEKEKRKNNS